MIQTTTYSPLLVNRDALYFISGDRRKKVPLDRVTYISVGEEETVIHTLGTRYPTEYQLSDIIEQLPPTQFFRIHPLHVVALQHVQGIDGKEVMIAGERLFTTHYYRAQLVEAFERRRPAVNIARTIKNRDTLL
jgi:two-component system LytT family response regulator